MGQRTASFLRLGNGLTLFEPSAFRFVLVVEGV